MNEWEQKGYVRKPCGSRTTMIRVECNEEIEHKWPRFTTHACMCGWHTPHDKIKVCQKLNACAETGAARIR